MRISDWSSDVCSSDLAHIAPLTRFLDGAELSDSEALWMKADLARLAAVRNDRAQAAEHYFAEHAGEWDAIRSLHVPEAEVEAAMQAMLGSRGIGRLLDVGTGTGRMLQLFGPSAAQVMAVEDRPGMLQNWKRGVSGKRLLVRVKLG